MNPPTLADLIAAPPLRVPPEAPLRDAAGRMESGGASAILVTRDGEVLGLITERDLSHALWRLIDPGAPVSTLMSAPVTSAPGTLSLPEGYHLLATRGYRHLLVTGPDGAPLGLLDESDFRRHLGLEYLVRVRHVRGLMTTHVLALGPEAAVADAAALMERHNISCVVVAEAEKPLGIVTERDMVHLFREGEAVRARPLASVMSRPLITLTADTPLHEAAETMQRHRLRRLVAVDGEGRLAGILTEHDLLKRLEGEYLEVLKGVVREQTRELERVRRVVDEKAALDLLLDTLPDLIWLKDPDGVYLTCNRAFERFFGAPAAEIVGKTDYHFVAAELADSFRANDQAAVEAGGPRRNEEWVTFADDGHRALLRTTKTPMYDAHGQLIGILGIGHDITEHHQAEVALRESEGRWQFALQGARDGVWDWNAATDEVFFSRCWKEMLGYEDDEIGNSLDEWDRRVHPDDKARCYADLARHFNGETPYYENEHRVRCKDGSYKWILDRGKVVAWSDDHKPLRVIGTHTDISRIKTFDEEMRRRSQWQGLLFRLSSGFINLPLSQVEASVQTALQEMAEFVSADRAYIFDYDFEARTTSNTSEWCAPGIVPQIDRLQGLPLDAIPDWVEPHARGEPVRVWDVAALPPGSLRDILEPQGIKSLLALPLTGRERCLGFVGFDWVGSHHALRDEDLQLLALFGQLLVNVTERRQAEAALDGQIDELRRWHDATLGRETRVLELKREVNALRAELGRPVRYPSVEGGEDGHG